jgi:NADP-dependent aldehyde dehydrogenase
MADVLVAGAYLETGLPAETRLRKTELPRTTGQLRQAAAAARSRGWCHATIDTKLNIRSMYAPLGGPVAVFGPNNFPFAFNSVGGGDFASAIAAGNPVIAKANPGHLGTTRLMAEAAFQAVQDSGLPSATVQLLYHIEPEQGFALVSHPLLGATAFTGSKNAGLRLKAAADAAGKPIYLEMSSINPEFMLPGALRERGDALAAEYVGSLLMGAGQFCTNPGLLVLIDGEDTARFIDTATEKAADAAPGVLLGEGVARHLGSSITALRQGGARLLLGGQPAASAACAYQNTLLRASGDQFLQNADALQTEAFGPAGLIVVAASEAQALDIADALQGNLTGAIYSDTAGSDDAFYDRLAPTLRAKVGRLLNDKMPTGVAVSPAMNHGGPFPSTGHPGFTAVGIPASLLRFGALQCYDNVRPHRLPPELADRNPTGSMWRIIDGEWTQRDITPPSA